MIRLAKTYATRHSYWQDTAFNLQCNELGCLDRHAFQMSHPSQIDRFPELVEVDKILIHKIQSTWLMILCFVQDWYLQKKKGLIWMKNNNSFSEILVFVRYFIVWFLTLLFIIHSAGFCESTAVSSKSSCWGFPAVETMLAHHVLVEHNEWLLYHPPKMNIQLFQICWGSKMLVLMGDFD